MKFDCGDINCSVKTLKALADAKRLRAAALLAAAGRALCVCELVDAMRESQYNVSRCLAALHAAGLIKKEKKGRWAMYSLGAGLGAAGAFIYRLVAPRPCCPVVAQDLARLKQRLTLRKNGACVVGGCC
ncbi:MAG TPA: metalloregulator ArsR/SmtB family transcription factor [Elusimicrobiales bacterium]|nr:metalloregulator ArsR/SmtB family transcription factor [Elusimicrobiales bacterium]